MADEQEGFMSLTLNMNQLEQLAVLMDLERWDAARALWRKILQDVPPAHGVVIDDPDAAMDASFAKFRQAMMERIVESGPVINERSVNWS